jgi:hypothetical protein
MKNLNLSAANSFGVALWERVQQRILDESLGDERLQTVVRQCG